MISVDFGRFRYWYHSQSLMASNFAALWPTNSNHSQSLMAGNFAVLWPTDSKISAVKDLILFSTVSNVQEASIILKVGFAFSKWPHLHRAYLVTVPEYLSQSVLASRFNCTLLYLFVLEFCNVFQCPSHLQCDAVLKECKNPCVYDDICAPGADCQVINNKAICTCPSTSPGNPDPYVVSTNTVISDRIFHHGF